MIPKIHLTYLVSPLLKPDKNPSEPLSSHLVSFTDIFICILEKVVKKSLEEHVETHNMFGSCQHRFRRKISTTSNILLHHEMIPRHLEEGKSVDTVNVDLSRAFNKVRHARLIRRLKRAWKNGRMEAWKHGRILHFF